MVQSRCTEMFHGFKTNQHFLKLSINNRMRVLDQFMTNKIEHCEKSILNTLKRRPVAG